MKSNHEKEKGLEIPLTHNPRPSQDNLGHGRYTGSRGYVTPEEQGMTGFDIGKMVSTLGVIFGGLATVGCIIASGGNIGPTTMTPMTAISMEATGVSLATFALVRYAEQSVPHCLDNGRRKVR